MTKEQQNRFLILFALEKLNYSSTKNEVLNYLLENDIIQLNESDFEILATRNEEKWRNELAFVRSHLVKDGYLSNLSRNKWEITPQGIENFTILSKLLNEERNPSRINKNEIENYNSGNRNLVNEEREVYKINSLSLSQTEKENIILSRIGQGIFRNDLIKLYGKCCLTEYNTTNILIASHIKPWKFSNDKERIDKFNGLLLLPTFDKLFDLGYITFKNNGKITISEELTNPEILSLKQEMKITVYEESKKYLEYHRKNVFIK
ncbi:winged helix-turn-helix domain-containing protein [uncultured Flavobacterium sp.]|uniref:winged helix-turn-helix domain-containing protein n=1 Tax=uncultured Flavobacterium sp. TaxID=165435 RepID=UPI00308204E8